MTQTPDERAKLRDLRFKYWTKRLDHTLTHTQTAGRMIYLIDGAVLALIYFAIKTFGASRAIVGLAVIPTAILFGLNVLHACFIASQQAWYAGIDKALMKLLRVAPTSPSKLPWYRSTHGVYRVMHGLIAFGLFVLGCLMGAYYFGAFELLKVAGEERDSIAQTGRAFATDAPMFAAGPVAPHPDPTRSNMCEALQPPMAP